MKNVLLVLSSPRGNESYSHRVANHVIDEIRATQPGEFTGSLGRPALILQQGGIQNVFHQC